ncbi:MAG: ElyC/SanA/YdcF family protein [Cardiobacteriaceae bacterium]|nr:ElyC/SanA/YdcF family protein [Cardiobacteriaceae bacterium]MDO4644022.1 ElyC/SanA/YdcF family protein [Cardiobacteriaceae bacterium]
MLRRLLYWSLLLLAIMVLIPALCYFWISWSSRAYLYDNVQDIPSRPLALVLGTAKYSTNGNINLFYRARIDAAAQLYRSGKVQYFIVSGDNSTQQYNEPAQMRHDLIAAGIPAKHIQPDYAGLRTLDSILRAEKVFGNRSYIIISQPFHNARAVFLARHHGQDVIALNAANPATINYRLKTQVREIGARMRAVWDVISGKQARYYGDTIPFPTSMTDNQTTEPSSPPP